MEMKKVSDTEIELTRKEIITKEELEDEKKDLLRMLDEVNEKLALLE